MRRITWLAVICICIISITSWHACRDMKAPTEGTVSENRAQPPILTKEMLDGWRTGGDLLAKSLALAFNEPNMVDVLMNSYDATEQGSIILSDFLESDVNGRSVKSILANTIDRTLEEFDRIIADATPMDLGEENWVLAIDFPVDSHYQKWIGGEPLQVMLSPWWVDEKDVTVDDLYAYDYSGTVQRLPLDTPPKDPTLVIVPTPFQTCTVECGGGAGGGGGSFIELWIDETIYYDNSEGMFYENPEFNTRLREIDTSGSWEKEYLTYIGGGSPGCQNPIII